MTPFTLVSPPARDTEGISLFNLLAEAGLAEDVPAGRSRIEVYVDTPAGRLYRAGWRLHHRPEDAGWILERKGQIVARQPGPPAANLGQGPVAEALAGIKWDGGLIPQLVVRRRQRVYEPDSAAFDAALSGPDTPSTGVPASGVPGRVMVTDFVFVDPHDEREKTGPRVLELTARDETAVGWELGRYLLNRIAGSKAATLDVLTEGLAALDLPRPGVPVPDALRLGLDDSMAEAMIKIFRGQAVKIRGLRRGTVLDLDPEYLHQLRVATRRARAAIRFFRPWLDERGAREVSAGLGEMGRVLGRVRDVDVLVDPLRADLTAAGVSGPVAERIMDAFAQRRRVGLEASIKLLQSPRFGEVVEGLELLTAVDGDAGDPAAQHAPRLLAKAAKKFKKWRGRKVSSLAEDDLHRIRIAIKRLRYLGEFFSPFGASGFPKAVRALVPYQDCLGEAQDARVAVDYLRGLAEFRAADGRPSVDELFALGELIRRQEKRKRDRRARFKDLWKQFPARSRRLRDSL